MTGRERALGARFFIGLLAALATGCGDDPRVPCPDGGTTLRYDNFGQGFLEANCNYCHAAVITNRAGAPTDFTFDTLDEVLARRDRILARAAGDRPSMPPGPSKPTAADRQRLAEWLACAPP